MSKTIDTADALVEAFLGRLNRLELVGVNLRGSAASGPGPELRLEAQNQKSILRIHPQLHPSRKLLQPLQKPTTVNDSGERWTSGDVSRGEIVIAPHIPEELAADFRRNRLNHADLNGRIFIQTPFYLLDRGPTEIAHRNPVTELDPFALKTSRVTRAILSRRHGTWQQEELTERTKVSRALVSRTLATLIQHGYVVQETRGNRHAPATYRLAEFDRLLDAWSARDAWEKRVAVQEYSVLGPNPEALAEVIREALGSENAVFTQWFAAHLRHPYTTPPIVSAYVRKDRSLPELPYARKVPTGGNVWLVIPEDEGVFFETQDAEGYRLVSDVQIYLDLVHMGQRGPDAAQALREWPDFAP